MRNGWGKKEQRQQLATDAIKTVVLSNRKAKAAEDGRTPKPGGITMAWPARARLGVPGSPLPLFPSRPSLIVTDSFNPRPLSLACHLQNRTFRNKLPEF